MPFELIRDDIARVKAGAIVNSANPDPVVGRGTDMAVFTAAGYDELLADRRKIGPIKPGEAAVTKAYALNADYIIHTVGPMWIDGNHDELETLASCYRKSLRLAEILGCKSVALPLISTGVYRFPKDLALKIALREIEAFCLDTDINVILVVYDRTAYELSSSLNLKVRSFIHERMAMAVPSESVHYNYAPAMSSAPREKRKEEKRSIFGKPHLPKAQATSHVEMEADMAMPASVAEVLKTKSETFQESLLSLIDEKGMSDPEVYKRANIDRKLFSKIRSNRNYVPKKKTCMALAVALKLSYSDAADLLAKAGYAFSPASPFDLILEYCIRNKIYSIFEINSILFEYDQVLL